MHKSEFPSKPYIPDQSTCVFEGVRIDVYSLKRGSYSREVISHPGAVVILPLLDKERVVLIHNDRFSVGEKLWELPAGTLEEGELPQETAKRELQEETGYTCQQINPLTFFYTTPGFCNERMFAYTASDLTLGSQHLDESEKITVTIFTWLQILDMLKSGKIKDGKTIATLLYYRTFQSMQEL